MKLSLIKIKKLGEYVHIANLALTRAKQKETSYPLYKVRNLFLITLYIGPVMKDRKDRSVRLSCLVRTL